MAPLRLGGPATVFGFAEMIDAWPEPGRKITARAVAARVEELRREWGPEHHKSILVWVASEFDVDPSTVSKYLNHPDRAPGPPSSRRRRGPAPVWTRTLVKRAIEAWWDRHGRPPTRMDWSPAQLKYRNRATLTRRLEAFSEGWTDTDGIKRAFPLAENVPFKELVAEVEAVRRARRRS